MMHVLTTPTFNRALALLLLTLMVLALVASPSAASRLEAAAPAAVRADPGVPVPGDHDFRHEGE